MVNENTASSKIRGIEPGSKEPTGSSEVGKTDLFGDQAEPSKGRETGKTKRSNYVCLDENRRDLALEEENMRSGLEKPGEPAEKCAVDESAHVERDTDKSEESSEDDEAEPDSDAPPRENDPRRGYVCLEGDDPAEPAKDGKVEQISERKREANRRNAQRSTGPKSEQGKMISRRNAILHGLLIRAVPLVDFVGGGERRELLELFETLYSELCPEGRVEEIFVERIACIYFQLARLFRFQKGVALAAMQQEDDKPFCGRNQTHYIRFEQYLLPRDGVLDKMVRYETMLDRELHRCLDRLERLQKQRRANGFRGSEPLDDSLPGDGKIV